MRKAKWRVIVVTFLALLLAGCEAAGEDAGHVADGRDAPGAGTVQDPGGNAGNNGDGGAAGAITSQELSQAESTALSNASSAGLPDRYRNESSADYLQLACAIAHDGANYTDGLYSSLVSYYQSQGETQSQAQQQVQGLQGMQNGLNLTSELCDAVEKLVGQG